MCNLKSFGKDCTSSRGDCQQKLCFLESHSYVMWLSNQPAAAALASMLMIHPMTLSILVLLPCLCDLTQLYKPGAVYHLGWREMTQDWITDASPGSGWACLCWPLPRHTVFWLHPSSTLEETDHGGWWHSPDIGPTTFVLSAKNQLKWNAFMTHCKDNAIYAWQTEAEASLTGR